jgi:hypothetical protein
VPAFSPCSALLGSDSHGERGACGGLRPPSPHRCIRPCDPSVLGCLRPTPPAPRATASLSSTSALGLPPISA